MSKDPAYPRQPSVSEELLALAQEAGRVGVFELQVQTGTLHLSERFLAIYGLTDFDGRYESWLKCVYREDHVRINDILESVFARRLRQCVPSSASFVQAIKRSPRSNPGPSSFTTRRAVPFGLSG